MAISSTPRLGLTSWSSDTDEAVTRVSMNADHAQLEALVAIDVQVDTFANLPPAGVPRRYGWCTATQLLYRDDGTIWVGPLNASPTTATPSGSTPGDFGSVGASALYARSDHTHGRETFSGSVAQVNAGSGGVGNATTVARGDHAHPVLAGTQATGSSVGDAQSAGGSTALARADHVHGREAWSAAAPVKVSNSAGAAGVSASPAHADHVHAVNSGAPGSSRPGDSPLAGSSPNLALADHVHSREPWATASSGLVVGAGTPGSGLVVARGDHTHALTAGVPGLSRPGDAATEGTSGALARLDHIHSREPWATASSGLVVGAGTPGSGLAAARGDHTHALTAGVPGLSTPGDPATEGTSGALARLDHKHGREMLTCTSASRPGSPIPNVLYLETDTGRIVSWVQNGVITGAWRWVGGASPGSYVNGNPAGGQYQLNPSIAGQQGSPLYVIGTQVPAQGLPYRIVAYASVSDCYFDTVQDGGDFYLADGGLNSGSISAANYTTLTDMFYRMQQAVAGVRPYGIIRGSVDVTDAAGAKRFIGMYVNRVYGSSLIHLTSDAKYCRVVCRVEPLPLSIAGT